MSESKFFDCIDCEHRASAPNPIWSQCSHPAVIEAGFSGHGIETYTDEDFNKLDHVVNDVLKLKLVSQGIKKEIPNFEFPFQYEPVWIGFCEGYEKRSGKKIRIWKSGKN